MNATLYLPQQPPLAVSTQGFRMPNAVTQRAHIPNEVSRLLGCAPGLVDILICGPRYVIYSVSDYESDTNLTAMEAVSKVSGIKFDLEDADMILCGPILIVTE